jgi:tetratricopeptide (TPR) repeat protein
VTAGRPRSFAIACAAACLLAIAAYANHFRNDFHFDDDHTIQTNAFIRDLRNIPRFFVDASTFSSLPSHQSYRPLLTATLAVDYAVGGGLNPRAFHATSFGLFAIQCLLMYAFFVRVMDAADPDPANRWVALLAAATYAVHPANAETVNYIIARSEILSTLGIVAAFVLFVRRRSARRYGLYLIPAAAAMLAKEQAAMFAPLLFVYVAIVERQRSIVEALSPRDAASTLWETWPAFAVCGALAVLDQRMATAFVPGGASRWHYLLAQPFVVVHYLTAFFLPIGLSADSDWQPIANPFEPRVVAGTAAIIGVVAAAVYGSRRRETRPIAFGLVWFLLALLPTSSVIPLAEVLNDHRTYFPYVGLTLAVAWSLRLALPRARQAIVVAAVAMLLLMAYGARQRNGVWRTEESLWLDVTRKSPNNGRGLMTYGVIRMGKGDYTTADEYFQRALVLVPEYSYLHVNIAILKGALRQQKEAEEHFLAAQRYDPDNPVSYFFYARWLAEQGRIADATAQARHAVGLSPGYTDAQDLLRSLTADPR